MPGISLGEPRTKEGIMETGGWEEQNKSELWTLLKDELLSQLKDELTHKARKSVLDIVEVFYERKMIHLAIRDELLQKVKTYFESTNAQQRDILLKKILTVAQTNKSSYPASGTQEKSIRGNFWAHQVDGRRSSREDILLIEHCEKKFNESAWLGQHKIRYP